MNDEFSGIVIDNKEYREHDAILHVLCEDGNILHIAARGIQKVKSKNAPACQLFTYTRMQLNYRETATMQSLKTAEIIKSYRLIREDLTKQSIASYFCECIDKSGFDVDVYSLLKKSLNILESTSHPLRILCLFQAIMNRMHGIEPFVEGCVRCGNQHNIYAISIQDGGFVCKNCYHLEQDIHRTKSQKKTIAQLKCFRLLCKADLSHYEILQTYPDFSYEDFEQLYAFFEDYAGIAVKSIHFLRCLMNMEKKKNS